MSDYPRFVLNRTVMMLVYKQPFLDWLNTTTQNPLPLTLEYLRDDNDTFLIPQFDNTDDAVKWVEKRWQFLFEAILFDWITDEALWPNKRTLNIFRDWFDIEVHSMVWDLANDPLLIDDWGGVEDCEDFKYLEDTNPNIH